MTSASVSLVLGPADWLECDARLVPVASSKVAPRAAAALSGSLRDRARAAARVMFFSRDASELAVALRPDDTDAPLAVLVRIPELGASGRDLQQRIDAGLEAALAALKGALATGGAHARRPVRLVIPCPSTLEWFRPSALEDGSTALLNGVRRIARQQNVDVVLAVEDLNLMRHLQRQRALEAQRWWEILEHDSFDLLANAARSLGAERAAVFVGSGCTGRNVYEGFDMRMRAVARRFRLSTEVPTGLAEGRHLLEALVAKCNEDHSGERWARLVRELRQEFGEERLGFGVLLVASLPTAWLGSLTPDSYLAAASDGIRSGPVVAELMGTYLEPASMSPTTAAEAGLPPLVELVSRVPASPNMCVFIGVERDLQTFSEVLEALDHAVPGFDSADKVLLQHLEVWSDDRPTPWSDAFASVVITEDGTLDERARAFEQVLDAFVALAWAQGQGVFKERARPDSTVVLRRASSSSSSVWAYNGGLPGGGRR